MALRVPISNRSISDMVTTMKKEVNREEVNKVLKDASEEELKGILEYTEEPIVSSDIIGNPHLTMYDIQVDIWNDIVIVYHSIREV
jgi:glyceraldehyde 3-phosphate dehydrogenase